MPAGIWPSLLVLTVTFALVSGMFGVGYFSLELLSARGGFLPTHRAPWFAESVIAFGMTYARSTEDQNDVLITGGSASQAGLVTRTYEDATGKRVFNFGTSLDIGPDGHFEFIRTYLRSHEPPGAIIYIAAPRDVGDEETGDVELRNRFGKAYAPSIKGGKMSPTRFTSFYVMEGKFAIERLITSGNLHPFDAPRGSRPSHNELAREFVAKRGFQEFPQSPRIDTQYLQELDRFTVSKWHDDSFREMARTSQALGITFTVYFTPIPRNDFGVDDGPLLAWAEAFEAEFPNAKVKGLPLVQYEMDLWGNGYHLNRRGAEIFTLVVANSIEGATAKAEGR